MKYAAFLRGINVGGKNIVKMDELRQLLSEAGLQNVKTYIQSGNIIFDSIEDEITIVNIISKAFIERFGFESCVIVRGEAEISKIISSIPFSDSEIRRAEDNMPDAEHLYVFLSNDMITTDFADIKQSDDKFYISEREIYFLSFGSIRNSKAAAAFFKQSAAFTSRNLKTLLKISELMSQ